MLGRIVYVPAPAISVTNDSSQDILELVGASGFPLELISIRGSSALTTDERLDLRLITRTSTGCGGSALTEVNANRGDGSTINVAGSAIVTTQGSAGATLTCWQWSELAEFIYCPVPEERPLIASGSRLCLALGTAVGSTRTMSWFATVREIG